MDTLKNTAIKQTPFKKTAMWAGIILIGSCGIVLLGGGKVTSGALLVVTAFILALPVKRHRLPLWIRIGLVCVVFGLVALNISTTELPDPSNGMTTACGHEYADTYEPTGIRFLDQVSYIFAGFLAQAAPS